MRARTAANSGHRRRPSGPSSRADPVHDARRRPGGHRRHQPATRAEIADAARHVGHRRCDLAGGVVDAVSWRRRPRLTRRWRRRFSSGHGRAHREAACAIAGGSRCPGGAGRGHAARRWPSATPSGSILQWRRRVALLRRRGSSKCHRLGTFPDRSLDIDVVFDLMIHDIDVVLSIVKSPVAAIDAVGVPVLTPTHRHRQRPAALRQRLHREPHGKPDQPRSDAQDPLLPAGFVRRRRLRRTGARGLAAGEAAGGDAVDRRRLGRDRAGGAAGT